MSTENKSVVQASDAQETLEILAQVFIDYLCSEDCATAEWHEKVRLCWTNCSLLLKEQINAAA